MKAIWTLLAVLVASLAQMLPLGSIGGSAGNWTMPNAATGIGSSVTSIPASAFANPLTNGSIILVGTTAGVTSASGQLVNDTAGNSYSQFAAGAQFGPGTPNLWCATNTHTTSSNVVSLSLVGGFTIPNGSITASEFVSANGAVTCSGFDDKSGSQTNSGSGTNNAQCGASGGKLTLSHTHDLVYGFFNLTSSPPFTAGTTSATYAQVAAGTTTNPGFAEWLEFPTIVANNFAAAMTTGSTGNVYQGFCASFHP